MRTGTNAAPPGGSPPPDSPATRSPPSWSTSSPTRAWVKAGQPLCLISDSGTGKSHLLIALGTAAAQQGYRVRYTFTSKLVNELVEAADEKQLSKTFARCGRLDLLCLDELGFLELDRKAPGCCSEY